MSAYKVTVEGVGVVEVAAGRKLVRGLEDAGVDVSHRCGGQARCTTCRVAFSSPEPPMGETERLTLEEDGVLGSFRLSCQIRLDRDMRIAVLQPVATAAWDDPGADVEE
jgi:ferredoxin